MATSSVKMRLFPWFLWPQPLGNWPQPWHWLVKEMTIRINNFLKDLDYSNGLSTQSYTSTHDFCHRLLCSINTLRFLVMSTKNKKNIKWTYGVDIVGHTPNFHKRFFLEAWLSVKDPQSGNNNIVIPEVYTSLARSWVSRHVFWNFARNVFTTRPGLGRWILCTLSWKWANKGLYERLDIKKMPSSRKKVSHTACKPWQVFRVSFGHADLRCT